MDRFNQASKVSGLRTDHQFEEDGQGTGYRGIAGHQHRQL